jgi:predicted transcriptional regulator of viral defense system
MAESNKDLEVKIEVLSKDIHTLTTMINSVVLRLTELEKTLLSEMTSMKYRNGKFDELSCKVKELEEYTNNRVNPIISRLDNEVLDRLVNISNEFTRGSRIRDTIIASVISGGLLIILNLVFLFWRTSH